LELEDNSLKLIQKIYKSDIRSMINFMQSNQDIKDKAFHIIDQGVWEELFNKIINNDKDNIDNIISYINTISNRYNVDKKNIIKDFINYIIRNKEIQNMNKFLNFVENIMHFEECNINHYVNYFISKLSSLLLNK
jgi:DNA polymerase III delta prime subunit